MSELRLGVFVTYALLCIVLTGTSAFAQVVVDQQAVAAALLGGDRAEKLRAVDRARAVGRDASPQLRSALITTLERESAMRAERWRSAQRGETLEPIMDDLYGSVAQAVVELRDPATIPALAGALGTGLMVIRAMAEFGEPAVPAILNVISAPGSRSIAADGGLLALRFIVEQQGLDALPPAHMEQIRVSTLRHLQSPGSITTLWRAIDLAVTLNDPGLIRIVEFIATDPDEVIARGVKDQDLIERTQERATDRLAGVPPLPRR